MPRPRPLSRRRVGFEKLFLQVATLDLATVTTFGSQSARIQRTVTSPNYVPFAGPPARSGAVTSPSHVPRNGAGPPARPGGQCEFRVGAVTARSSESCAACQRLISSLVAVICTFRYNSVPFATTRRRLRGAAQRARGIAQAVTDFKFLRVNSAVSERGVSAGVGRPSGSLLSLSGPRLRHAGSRVYLRLPRHAVACRILGRSRTLGGGLSRYTRPPAAPARQARGQGLRQAIRASRAAA